MIFSSSLSIVDNGIAASINASQNAPAKERQTKIGQSDDVPYLMPLESYHMRHASLNATFYVYARGSLLMSANGNMNAQEADVTHSDDL